jgi:hypothetical protein
MVIWQFRRRDPKEGELHVTSDRAQMLIRVAFLFSQSLVDYESRDSDDDNADEDLKDEDAPATKKARLDLE